jgi:hypothetical protein
MSDKMKWARNAMMVRARQVEVKDLAPSTSQMALIDACIINASMIVEATCDPTAGLGSMAIAGLVGLGAAAGFNLVANNVHIKE